MSDKWLEQMTKAFEEKVESMTPEELKKCMTDLGIEFEEEKYYIMRELLERYGWTMESESPLEISHSDGSFATNRAAKMVISTLRNENDEY